jgi:hypothetical protein
MIHRLRPRTGRTRRIGLAGLAACILALGISVADPRALAGWLAACLFWSSLPIGALVLAMMTRLIPGRWAAELRPLTDYALMLLPLAALSILPVLLAPSALYDWVHAAPESGFRAVYLTPWFFSLRTLAFFAVAMLLAVLLLNRRRDQSSLSAVGLIVLVLTNSMIATDWLMSLDAGFHSSGFGLYVLSIQVTIALASLILARLNEPGARAGVLGGLLLTALLLWAYLAFMQYVIIWSGNLPEGVLWYQRRAAGFWSLVEYAIGALHLAPAFLLLFGAMRRSPSWLAALALSTLIGKAMEAAWLVLPARTDHGWPTAATSILAFAGLGCLTLAVAAEAPRLLQGLDGKRLHPKEAAR